MRSELSPDLSVVPQLMRQVRNMGKVGVPDSDGDPHMRDSNHGYAYGMRF